jgi:apolipoprotein D and lipocalin family protein
MPLRPLLASLTAAASVACATAAWAMLSIPPQPAKPVDPSRYVGRWYEVARLPNKVQTGCDAATSDWARDSGGTFDVVQTCRGSTWDGKVKVWKGSGKIIDARTNAKFRIGFFAGMVKEDYWVLDRADDYTWCILTTPNPRFLWIMARKPLGAGQRAALIERARQMGYDTSALIFDRQAAVS